MGAEPKWAISLKRSSGPIDTPWGARLRQIEERVAGSEESGIRARWESGRHLLKQRKGRQLPKGLLDQASSALGVSRRELNRRMAFHEAYQSEEKLSHAVAKFKTWKQIITKGLPKKRKVKRGKPEAALLRFIQRGAIELKNADPNVLTDAHVKSLRIMRDEIIRILCVKEGK